MLPSAWIVSEASGCGRALFAELTPTEQWQLHDFFLPDKELPDLALLQQRAQVRKGRLSLPHQAGRALNRFWETVARVGLYRVPRAKGSAGSAKRVRRQDRRIVVEPLVRPEVDARS